MKNKCKECDGKGVYYEEGTFSPRITCEECDGKGGYYEGGTFSPRITCEMCNGTGDGNYKYPLTFDKLREVNVTRCEKDIRPLSSWTPLEWGGALAGETGELCNMLKKLRRGEKVDIKDISHELADVITYADLVAAKMGINLGEAVREKFNIVSKRWKSKYTL